MIVALMKLKNVRESGFVSHGFLLASLFFLITIALAGLVFWTDIQVISTLMLVVLFIAISTFTAGVLGVYLEIPRSSLLRSMGILTIFLTIAGLGFVLLIGLGLIQHSLLLFIFVSVYAPFTLSLLILKGLSITHDDISTRQGNLFVIFFFGVTILMFSPMLVEGFVQPILWLLTLGFLAVISHVLWRELSNEDPDTTMNEPVI